MRSKLLQAGRRALLSIASAVSGFAKRFAEAGTGGQQLTVVPPSGISKAHALSSWRRAVLRPLTGEEIRSVRVRKNAFGTNRMGRSRYVPDGIPARITKQNRLLTAALATAA